MGDMIHFHIGESLLDSQPLVRKVLSCLKVMNISSGRGRHEQFFLGRLSYFDKFLLTPHLEGLVIIYNASIYCIILIIQVWKSEIYLKSTKYMTNRRTTVL